METRARGVQGFERDDFERLHGGMKMKTTARKKKRSGFTLIEAMIGVFVITIGLSGYLASYVQALRTTKVAQSHFRANCLARNRLQRALMLDYDNLPALAEDDVAITALGQLSPDGTYKRTTVVDTNVYDNCTLISVRVNFPIPGRGTSYEPVDVTSLLTPEMLQ